ncbi:MAG: YceD family protein [Coprobacillaceae bacterium]
MINLRYNLQWIVKQQGNFTIDEGLTFPSEMFEKYPHINNLKDILVQGTGNLDTREKRLYVDLEITGIMLLPCALTLEELEYPFTVSTTEVFSFEKPNPEEDIREVKKNIVDLTPVVFENIMLDVPMRVVKDEANIVSEGKGWKMLDNAVTDKDDDYIDPRLAKLKDYFKDK